MFKHKSHGGKFDPKISCENVNKNRVVVEKQGPAEIECCGEYAERFPYSSKGGLNGCCGISSYSKLLLECCEGDVLKATCD